VYRSYCALPLPLVSDPNPPFRSRCILPPVWYLLFYGARSEGAGSCDHPGHSRTGWKCTNKKNGNMKHSGTRALQMEAVSSNDSELIAYIIDLLTGRVKRKRVAYLVLLPGE
jgi:hypothetical protein